MLQNNVDLIFLLKLSLEKCIKLWLKNVQINYHSITPNRSKGTILSCIKSLLTKCLYEPPLITLYGSAMEPFEAAFDCMCSPENFGKNL